MIVRRDFKVPGGKLLRIELEVEAGTVLRAAVRGDFFAHPEEAFEAAEAQLHGVPVDRLAETALALFGRGPLEIFGASARDIAEALKETAGEAQTH